MTTLLTINIILTGIVLLFGAVSAFVAIGLIKAKKKLELIAQRNKLIQEKVKVLLDKKQDLSDKKETYLAHTPKTLLEETLIKDNVKTTEQEILNIEQEIKDLESEKK